MKCSGERTASLPMYHPLASGPAVNRQCLMASVPSSGVLLACSGSAWEREGEGKEGVRRRGAKAGARR